MLPTRPWPGGKRQLLDAAGEEGGKKRVGSVIIGWNSVKFQDFCQSHEQLGLLWKADVGGS